MALSYTPRDVDRWLRAYNEGCTIEDIAFLEHYSTTTVQQGLLKHPDYVARPRSARKINKLPTLPKSPRPTGVHQSRSYSRRRKGRTGW